jgi:MFS family permease
MTLPSGVAGPWRVVLIAFLPAWLTHFSVTGGRVVVALDLLRSGESTLVVGLIASLFGAIPAVAALWMGRFIDREGPRRSAALGVAATLGGLLAAVAAPGSVGALAATALLVGGGTTLTFLMQQHVIAQAVPSAQRLTYLAWTGVFYSFTHFLGPLVAGLSIDHLGMHTAYLIFASSAALAILPVAFLHASRPPPPAAGGARRSVLDLLANRELRSVYVLSGLVLGCWEAHQILLPIYGTSVGLSATAIGSILAAFSAAIVLARIIIPIAARHFGEWRLLSLSLAISGTCFVAYPWFSSALTLGTLAFLMGFAAGLNQPLVGAMLLERAPPGRSGEALGLRSTIVSCEQIVVPTVLGTLAGVLGIAPIYLAAAAVAWGGSIYGSRVARRAAAAR